MTHNHAPSSLPIDSLSTFNKIMNLDGDENEIDAPKTLGVEAGRFIKDPVHDYIPFSARLAAFIDTRQFQRLRYVKQLGTSCYVWPGASHNRFEHSLGVAYLARLMVEHLQRDQPELGICDREVECVELAGLCHDLGHGPWSHVWDTMFIPVALKGRNWCHEDASESMLDYLIQDNDVEIDDRDVTFIKALIAGDPTRCSANPEKLFLFEIVANKRNGIDVDKFDYISRACRAIGERGNLSLSRLINSARVIDNQICYHIKDANQMYELCYTRFSLHKRIYNHKAARAIEYMIIDALLAAEPILHIAEQIDYPEKYVHLTDDIMQRIESNPDPQLCLKRLAESRAILDRIHARELYKCVDYKVFEWHYKELCKDYITPERIVNAAKSLNIDSPIMGSALKNRAKRKRLIDSLEADDVIVDLTTMHYGMKEKNPLDSIKFYSKTHPDQCALAGPGDISTLMPNVFGEVLLRIYVKDAEFFGITQAGYRAVLQTMPDPVSSTPALPYRASFEALVPTPPATEAPSTPKAQSRNPSLSSLTETTPLGQTFSNNQFTTVPPHFVPASPSQSIKKGRNKRGRVEGGESASDVTPTKKRKPT